MPFSFGVHDKSGLGGKILYCVDKVLHSADKVLQSTFVALELSTALEWGRSAPANIYPAPVPEQVSADMRGGPVELSVFLLILWRFHRQGKSVTDTADGQQADARSDLYSSL